MAGALSGIKVLDLSRVLAGPWTGQLLADLGAEVIKVERPGSGDDTRHWSPPSLPDGTAAYYLAANRGKQSLTVDITQPAGQQIVRQLAAECDVLLENYKVGGLKKYGLDYDSLQQLNPRLVYCSITGFGQDGPYAELPGYDYIVQGMSGLMSITGPADGEPHKVGVAVTDLFTGLYAANAVQAALLSRHHTGVGQYIDMALFDCALAMLSNVNMNWLVGGIAFRAPDYNPNDTAASENQRVELFVHRRFGIAQGIRQTGKPREGRVRCSVADHVGAGARIGSNAVVLKAVPAGATAVGIPARILETTESQHSFTAYGITPEDLSS